MGLGNSENKFTFVNITKGRLSIGKGGDIEYYDNLTGTIQDVTFENNVYKGDTFEIAKFLIKDSTGQKFMLQIRTDSGYFRGLVNCLKSVVELRHDITITPFYKEKDDKVQTTCFVKQDGKFMKHFYLKDNMKDLPPLEKVKVKGKESWDSSKQIQFWKDWLKSIVFATPVEPGAVDTGEPIPEDQVIDDLPF